MISTRILVCLLFICLISLILAPSMCGNDILLSCIRQYANTITPKTDKTTGGLIVGGKHTDNDPYRREMDAPLHTKRTPTGTIPPKKINSKPSMFGPDRVF